MANYNINVGVNAYQAARGIAQLRSNFRDLNNQADRTRNLLSTLFITPLVGIYTLQSALVNIVQVMAEFSQSMATVRAITGATERQVQSLEREFMQLGVTTRFTASEAANAGVFLARAGFNARQIQEIVGPSLDLALATNIPPDRAADIATNVQTAFNLSLNETQDIFDQLAFVTNRTNTDLLQLSEALKFIAPAAESANLPLNEVIAALGLLAQAGIRGSIAGTGLRRVISGLASEAPIIRRRLDELGLTFDDVGITSGDLIHVFTTLIEHGVELGDSFALFGVRGGPAFEAIADRVPELIRLAEETQNAAGFVDELAQIMEQSLETALLRVKSAIQGIVLSIGTIIEPDVILFLNNFADSLRALTRQTAIIIDGFQSLGLLIGISLVNLIANITIPLLGLVTGFTRLGRSIFGLGASIFGPLEENASRTVNILNSVGNVFGSLFTIASRVFTTLGILIVAFSDKLQLVFDEAATLQDFLISLAIEVGRQFGIVNNIIALTQGGISGLVEDIRELVTSESFLRGFVTAVDIIVRSILVAVEAIQLLLSPGVLFDAFFSYVRVQFRDLVNTVIRPILRAVDFISTPLRLPETATFTEIFDAENRLVSEDEARAAAERAAEGIRGPFDRINELLAGPVLNFEEIVANANASALLHIASTEEDINRINNEIENQRAELTDPPAGLSEAERRNQLFNRYLNNLREARSVVLETGRARDIAREILEAQDRLGFDLVGHERDRLRLLIEQIDLQEGQGIVANRALQLIRENDLLRITNVNERERQRVLLEIRDEIENELHPATAALIESLIMENQVLEEYDRILQRLLGQENQRVLEREALNEAFERGVISLQRYNRELLNLELAELSERVSSGEGTFLDGFMNSLGNFAGSFTNIFSELGTIVGDFTVNAINRFSDFVGQAIFETGSLTEAFKTLARSIISDLVASLVRVTAQLIINNALAAAFNLSTGGSGFLSGILGFRHGGLVPNFQAGGAVDGPGTSTSDSILARLSRGEFVVNAQATQRNRSLLESINSGQESQRPIIVNYNISTPNADSFRRSQNQILGATEANLNRAARRNRNEF